MLFSTQEPIRMVFSSLVLPEKIPTLLVLPVSPMVSRILSSALCLRPRKIFGQHVVQLDDRAVEDDQIFEPLQFF